MCLCALVLFLWAGCNNESIPMERSATGIETENIPEIQWTSTNDEIENITDEQLINLVYKEDKIAVADFYTPDDFGVALKEKEWWHEITLNPISTFADAEKEVTSFVFMQNPGSHTIDYIGENDFYYEFRVEYINRSWEEYLKYHGKSLEEYTYTSRIIVYKESVKYCAFNSQTGYYFEIRDLDKDSVKNLLDLDAFLCNHQFHSANIIYRDFVETDNEYIYTYYRTFITGNDWNVNCKAVLEKMETSVNKKTGEYIGLWKNGPEKFQILKEVSIPGTALRP